jgi:hypothetical protein
MQKGMGWLRGDARTTVAPTFEVAANSQSEFVAFTGLTCPAPMTPGIVLSARVRIRVHREREFLYKHLASF